MPILSLDLSDEMYQDLQKDSQSAGISMADYVILRLHKKKQEKPVYLIDLLKELPMASFKDKDPLEIKKELRDEWD